MPGPPAVHEDEVRVLHLRHVQPRDDGVGVRHLLPVRDGGQRSLGQVRVHLAVLPCPQEVAAIDGGRGEVPGLAHVPAAPRSTDIAGLRAVGVGGGAHLRERITPVA